MCAREPKRLSQGVSATTGQALLVFRAAAPFQGPSELPISMTTSDTRLLKSPTTSTTDTDMGDASHKILASLVHVSDTARPEQNGRSRILDIGSSALVGTSHTWAKASIVITHMREPAYSAQLRHLNASLNHLISSGHGDVLQAIRRAPLHPLPRDLRMAVAANAGVVSTTQSVYRPTNVETPSPKTWVTSSIPSSKNTQILYKVSSTTSSTANQALHSFGECLKISSSDAKSVVSVPTHATYPVDRHTLNRDCANRLVNVNPSVYQSVNRLATSSRLTFHLRQSKNSTSGLQVN
jgi:hypothetical protein